MTGGCGDRAAQDLTVHWLLADGRSCIDAAVVLISITAEGGDTGASPSTAATRCPANPGTATLLLLPAVYPGARVRGSGVSASSSVLYRGEATAPDPARPSLDLVLYFTGGR